MGIVIRGLGTAVPPHAIEQEDASAHAATVCGVSGSQSRLVARLYARSGVQRRGSVLLTSTTNGHPAQQEFFRPATAGDPSGPTTATRMRAYREFAPPLAREAATRALADACAAPSSITHLVTVSCSGFDAPGVDIDLVDALPLPPTVARTHVGYMGCHGALNGLRVAQAFAAAAPQTCVLLVAVELCSLHFQYPWNPQGMVANSLFADGAAALVLGRREESDHGLWNVDQGLSVVFANSSDAMTWRIGDHGFEMALSPTVPSLIRDHLHAQIAPWLARQGLTIGEVANWALHPGGPRILDACRDALGLGDADLVASRKVLEDYGNMSSPTVLFVLDELRRRVPTMGPTVLIGFGPGLALEAALLSGAF
ncbi:MAG: type III polyketide synthase [Pirellulales bacterium]